VRKTGRWVIENCVWDRGETEPWSLQFCVLRRERNRAVGAKVLCVERGELMSGGR